MKNSIALLRTFKTRFLNKKKGFSQNGSKEGEREKEREVSSSAEEQELIEVWGYKPIGCC